MESAAVVHPLMRATRNLLTDDGMAETALYPASTLVPFPSPNVRERDKPVMAPSIVLVPQKNEKTDGKGCPSPHPFLSENMRLGTLSAAHSWQHLISIISITEVIVGAAQS